MDNWTFCVFQLLEVADCIPGVDVKAMAVSEVSQDMFGVEGRGSVEHQLRETQRAHCRDFKSVALARKNNTKNY